MSLYADYLKERTHIEIIEKDYGFITYSFSGEECYIRDLYIAPIHRHANLASSLADLVVVLARQKGCKYLVGTVCPEAKNVDASLKVLMAYGMTLHSSSNNLIIFKKDIV